MCGIARIYEPTGKVDSGIVRSMVRELVYRGPDGDGFYADDRIALGMRRLAIIDVEHGNQPLANERGNVVVTTPPSPCPDRQWERVGRFTSRRQR